MALKKWMVVCLACVAAIGLSAQGAAAKKNACGKEMSAAEMAERALAVQEIQYAMGLHQLYGAPGGDHDREIELVWAQNQPDVSFAGNGYIVQGDIDVIYSFYGSGSRKNKKTEAAGGEQQHMAGGGAGSISYRLLTTPIIQVAGDLKTAKAWWYTPGFQSNVMNGSGSAIWSYEKYGIDFINEDGEWKIWHFHVYNDWEIPMGEDLVKYTAEKANGGGQQMQGDQGTPPEGAPEMAGGQGAPPEGGPEMAGGQGAPPQGGQASQGAASPARQVSDDVAPYYTEKKFGESYSLTRDANPLTSPRPPESYCTFSDTFSYADE